MKRFLLTAVVLSALVLGNKSNAQCNTSTPVINYTNANKTGVAPFAVNGNTTDWQLLLGAPTGNASTPYNPPATSASNFAMDGIVGPPDDRDLNITAPRDLRFFAFTYDDYNVYFYFRRINNGNAQSCFMYLCDINADGFINTGEPVFRAAFNSSSVSNFSVSRYLANQAVDYVVGKGNYMTDPVTGFADGYSVAGNTEAIFLSSAIPAGYTLQANEKFGAIMTEEGFGIEFAVPWRYFRNWGLQGATAASALANTPLNPENIFTYHVLTQNGQNTTTTTAATDNAGGCCSGLAVSGTAKVEAQPVAVSINGNSLRQYRARLAYNEVSGGPTNVLLESVTFSNQLPDATTPNPENFLVNVSADADGNGVPDAGTTQQYLYNLGDYIPQGTPLTITIPANGTAKFIVDVDFMVKGIKTIDLSFATTTTLDLPLGSCVTEQIPQSNSVSVAITTPLPVKFKSFTADRKNSSTVNVKWTTASEQNNRGFNVQRNVGGKWKNVAFVFSLADDGNSASDLSYEFNDANGEKGMTQYRIQQVDLDGKASYSEIRAVRGENAATKILIYPNPSSNGQVNIVFENNSSLHDVTISDMQGRTIKQYGSVTGNILTVENLKSGFYTIKIMDRRSAVTSVEKVVVK